MTLFPFHPKPIAMALSGALFAVTAFANPTGGQVVLGNATIQSVGNQTAINQSSNRAIINWQGFSIRPGETTRFNMPSASSAVLNRVTGGNVSELAGTLSANGQVFLINPNGVLVGNGAVINTGAFIASTRDVSNQQFMNGGGLDFFGNSNATIVNLGTINAASGDVVLLAYQVNNAGTINAPAGAVALASGSEVFYAPQSNERILIKASALPDGGSVSNEGTLAAAQAELKAAGGNPYALSVNAGGNISAVSLDSQGGRIVLNAAAGTTRVAGKLSAVSGDKGGEILVTGQQVAVADSAELNASGIHGGGRIAVGGGDQGKDSALQNAQATDVAQGARISADAKDSGNGGRVTVWADGRTSYRGDASVRGGADGGDGGRIEVSGKDVLEYRGTVDMRAPRGKAGTLLLDPTDITIVHGGAGSGLTVSGATSTITDTDLNNALTNGNVTISTSSGGNGHGDITVAADASPMAYVFTGISNSLTLQAGRDIAVNHSLVVFNNSPGTSAIILQAGRNLAITNPSGVDGDVGIMANNLTLIADAANGGNGSGNMTVANGAVLSGDNIRLFVPTASLLTLPSSTTVGGTTTTGKWVGDAGTSAQGIYYKRSASDPGTTQTPGTSGSTPTPGSSPGTSGSTPTPGTNPGASGNTQTPGTNLTPGQTQVGANGGNQAVVISQNTQSGYRKLFGTFMDMSGNYIDTIGGINLAEYGNFVQSVNDEALSAAYAKLLAARDTLKNDPNNAEALAAGEAAKRTIEQHLPDPTIIAALIWQQNLRGNTSTPEIDHLLRNIDWLLQSEAKVGRNATTDASIRTLNRQVAVLLAVNKLQTSSRMATNIDTTMLSELLANPNGEQSAKFVNDYMEAAKYLHDEVFDPNFDPNRPRPSLQPDSSRPYLPMPNTKTPVPKNRQEALALIQNSLKTFITGPDDGAVSSLSQQIQEQQSAIADLQTKKQQTENYIKQYGDSVGNGSVVPGSSNAPKSDFNMMFSYGSDKLGTPSQYLAWVTGEIATKTTQVSSLTAQFNAIRAEQTAISALLILLN